MANDRKVARVQIPSRPLKNFGRVLCPTFVERFETTDPTARAEYILSAWKVRQRRPLPTLRRIGFSHCRASFVRLRLGFLMYNTGRRCGALARRVSPSPAPGVESKNFAWEG
jgi:hypothetical protein